MMPYIRLAVTSAWQGSKHPNCTAAFAVSIAKKVGEDNIHHAHGNNTATCMNAVNRPPFSSAGRHDQSANCTPSLCLAVCTMQSAALQCA